MRISHNKMERERDGMNKKDKREEKLKKTSTLNCVYIFVHIQQRWKKKKKTTAPENATQFHVSS